MTAVLGFVGAGLAANMLLAYVYGWTRCKEFDEEEAKEGVGRFKPVMLVWTACLAFEVAVALIDLAVTGSPIPFHDA